MTLSLDKALGPAADALQLHERRTQLLAENIANADTPNYKARDLDFRAAMRQAAGDGGLALNRTSAGHLTPPGSSVGNPTPQYRVPANPSLDGNTVELDQERGRFAESTVNYQASLQFLGSRFTGLINALRRE
ncbi:flagellar basal body rod protein FlgB [Sediminicurvatus halobius]|uniref:Flagellar basal body rod protein FlgB n=1 Tax=Sediminicurvatus halobius TaxID=2182432 RepID=A0A2U2N021_9GAMM|nr:flagellar basal body rod protein FlgB [Spiribacter halobius]PWG62314.1 flagellar basal body rod protein FlgB [Spiribacter halobius]UEX79765.1 flagellar basal body rod protein FlgB [Spiribacter halobius]